MLTPTPGGVSQTPALTPLTALGTLRDSQGGSGIATNYLHCFRLHIYTDPIIFGSHTIYTGSRSGSAVACTPAQTWLRSSARIAALSRRTASGSAASAASDGASSAELRV